MVSLFLCKTQIDNVMWHERYFWSRYLSYFYDLSLMLPIDDSCETGRKRLEKAEERTGMGGWTDWERRGITLNQPTSKVFPSFIIPLSHRHSLFPTAVATSYHTRGNWFAWQSIASVPAFLRKIPCDGRALIIVCPKTSSWFGRRWRMCIVRAKDSRIKAAYCPNSYSSCRRMNLWNGVMTSASMCWPQALSTGTE